MANTHKSKLLTSPTTLEGYETVVVKPYLVSDIEPGYGGSAASYLTSINGTLYFFTSFPIDSYGDFVGLRLWKSDGTSSGTVAIKDISPLFYRDASPQGLTNFNGIFYFLANTDGYKLWKSDGTSEGTVDVVNFAGDRYTSPRLLANINGTLYFSVYDGDEDYYDESHFDLWKSDGTAEGTFRLKEFYPENSFAGIGSSINVNGTLYFTVSKASYDEEGYYFSQTILWKSDGTTAGTVPFKELNGDIAPYDLTAVNKIFYFTTGYRGDLWKSDGTEIGTVKVKDINALNLKSFNDTLYFLADPNPDEDTYGYELWKSDGTAEGTVLVKDINPGLPGSFDYYTFFITEVNGTLYFYANDGTHGLELWKSDGTAEGTVLVKDINPGSGNSTVSYDNYTVQNPLLTNVNGILYFYADDGIHGGELWKSDGTAEGTVLVQDIKPGANSSNISDLTNVDGTLYFKADDGIHGPELWALNTNPPVASPIVSITALDINAAEAGNDAAVFRISRTGDTDTALTVIYSVNGTAINGQDYDQLNGSITIAAGQSFVDLSITPLADTFPEGDETITVTLFDQYYQYYVVDPSQNAVSATIADDTSAVVLTQPYLVKDILPGAGSSEIANLIKVNDTILFTKFNGTYSELWKSDGTNAGTVFIKEISDSYSPIYRSLNVNGIFYFVDYQNATLWKTDGTETGTVVLKVSTTSANNDYSYISDLSNVNGTLFFTYNTYNSTGSKYELWKTNGTDTVLVKEISASQLTNVNGKLYFASNNNTYGTELWKSDGTSNGTVRVKDINPGSGSSYPSNLLSINNTLYFFANDGIHGTELWKSNGTSSNTVKVSDINPWFYGYSFSGLRNINDILFFTVSDQYGYVQQLWTSDGNATGTFLLKDISETSSGSLSINLLTTFNDSLYFTINQPTSQSLELWKTDGTKEGTVLLKDINSVDTVYYYSVSVSNATDVDGILYFTYGDTLWKSDGTQDGTVLVKDIFAGDFDYSDNRFNQLINANGTLYFTADDGINGRELWKSDGTEAGTVMVKDLNPGDASSSPYNLTFLNDTLYFTADDGIHGNELWAVKTVNTINGGKSRDPLIGTAGDDRIVGGTGKKTITGGAGKDEFVYTSIREVGHRITDFTVGEDKIVLTQLLDSFVSGGYSGSNAIADGYVRLVQGSTANSTILQIDRDGAIGNAVARNFIELDNVTPQAMNNPSNFVF